MARFMAGDSLNKGQAETRKRLAAAGFLCLLRVKSVSCRYLLEPGSDVDLAY